VLTAYCDRLIGHRLLKQDLISMRTLTRLGGSRPDVLGGAGGAVPRRRFPAGRSTRHPHVFVLMLENQTATSPSKGIAAPYLAKTCERGALLAITMAWPASLGNYIRSSAQARTRDAADCRCSRTSSPATRTDAHGQLLGVGCVYQDREDVPTTRARLHVEGYMEDMGKDPIGECTCGMRASVPGGTHVPRYDKYAARHDRRLLPYDHR